MSSFRPYMTTHGTFEEVERSLHDDLVKDGYSEKLAAAMAHSFTLFKLGYITPEGVAYSLLEAGADESTARELALMIVNPEHEPDALVVNG